ncbi:hypothetical protein GLOIN_2v1766892 [Rhizophagus irregularis DAOM 181602=DAOM 197198]|nr:hypothetical protein GLOIN_2v1766892 [Rhizophagus irregularis DAOM 181602=DAOM 197198]
MSSQDQPSQPPSQSPSQSQSQPQWSQQYLPPYPYQRFSSRQHSPYPLYPHHSSVQQQSPYPSSQQQSPYPFPYPSYPHNTCSILQHNYFLMKKIDNLLATLFLQIEDIMSRAVNPVYVRQSIAERFAMTLSEHLHDQIEQMIHRGKRYASEERSRTSSSSTPVMTPTLTRTDSMDTLEEIPLITQSSTSTSSLVLLYLLDDMEEELLSSGLQLPKIYLENRRYPTSIRPHAILLKSSQIQKVFRKTWSYWRNTLWDNIKLRYETYQKRKEKDESLDFKPYLKGRHIEEIFNLWLKFSDKPISQENENSLKNLILFGFHCLEIYNSDARERFFTHTGNLYTVNNIFNNLSGYNIGSLIDLSKYEIEIMMMMIQIPALRMNQSRNQRNLLKSEKNNIYYVDFFSI